MSINNANDHSVCYEATKERIAVISGTLHAVLTAVHLVLGKVREETVGSGADEDGSEDEDSLQVCYVRYEVDKDKQNVCLSSSITSCPVYLDRFPLVTSESMLSYSVRNVLFVCLCRLSYVFQFVCVEQLSAKEVALYEPSWMIARLT